LLDLRRSLILREDCKHFDCIKELREDLRESFVDTMVLARFVNVNVSEPQKRNSMDGFAFHDLLLLVGHRLIQICALGDSRQLKPLENCIHLGLLACLVTLMGSLAQRRPQYPLLASLIRTVARSDYFRQDADKEGRRALLWLLFMGRASVLTSADDEWLDGKILDAMKAGEIRTMENLSVVLSMFPWITVLHDRPPGIDSR
jgi:hypothetical protein